MFYKWLNNVRLSLKLNSALSFQEKMEKEKLEKLNFMLQENICMARSAFPVHQMYQQSVPVNSNSNAVYGAQLGCNNSSGLGYNTRDNLQNQKPDAECNHQSISKTVDKNNCNSDRQTIRCDLSDKFQQQANSKSFFDIADDQVCVDKTLASDRDLKMLRHNLLRKYIEESTCEANDVCQVVPNRAGFENESSDKKCSEIQKRSQSEIIKTSDVQTEDCETQCQETTQDKRMALTSQSFIRRPKTLLNRNAEIQCGTPFVFAETKNKKNDTDIRSKFLNGSCQTDFQKTPLVILKPLEAIEEIVERENPDDDEVFFATTIENSVSKSNEVSLRKSTDLTSTPKRPQTNRDGTFNDREDVFLKPTSLPPRSKVRITPSGKRNMPFTEKLTMSDPCNDLNNSACSYDSDSSLHSEFDMCLIRNIRCAPKLRHHTPSGHESCSFVKPLGHASQVIKSQNNTNKIDKHVAGRERNEADKWNTGMVIYNSGRPLSYFFLYFPIF